MDKRIIFSVAGSGKTTLIVNNLDLKKRVLILTYTENNINNLRYKIIKKFGFFPENIKIYTYFSFIYNFCYRPFCSLDIKAIGMNWSNPPKFTTKLKRNDLKFYLDSNRRFYHNRLAKFFHEFNIVPLVIQRLEKYFDELCVDEVQDFASHDFNFLIGITKANINILLVGDFFQHTFDTSRDGVVNKSLHDDYEKYKNKFKSAGIFVDLTTLSSSYRCSPSICNFINDKLKILISSHRNDEVQIEYLSDEISILEKINCPSTVKLFYNNHSIHGLFSQNWGASKGLDHFKDVCVILNNETFKNYQKDSLHNLKSQTKNKLYVACTRASGNLYFIEEKELKRIMKS